MRGAIILAAMVLVVAGCGGGEGDCDVSGTYNVSAVEVSGTCGAFPSGQTATVNCEGQPEGNCQGTNIWDADCCGVYTDVFCEGESGTSSLEGRLDFSEGGDRGEGFLDIVLSTTEGQSCSSSYKFLYLK